MTLTRSCSTAVAIQGHQHHRQVLQQPHHLLPILVIHLHLGAKQLIDAGPEQLNLVVVHLLIQQPEGGDTDLWVGVVDLGNDAADGLVWSGQRLRLHHRGLLPEGQVEHGAEHKVVA